MEPLQRVEALTGARSALRGERIQSLWRGYGEVVRVHLDGGPTATVVVKHVRPPPDAHPRKLRSYAVEQVFYTDYAGRCGEGCRVPRCLGVWSDGRESMFVLEDLDRSGFGIRRRVLPDPEIDACLRWLATFHATFLGQAPEGLWEVGTYWHLATRPDELRAMRNAELQRLAPQLDARLSGARFRTLVHGDAKTANFCFAADGRVAAVDFQYVGGGCGMKDVTYFLGGALRAVELEKPQQRWLDTYFEALRTAVPPGTDFGALEAEWRALYAVARLDFERFLDGWR